MTAAIVRRLSSTFPVLRYFGTLPYSLHRQIKSSFARNLWPTAVDLGSQQASIVDDLNRKGYAIIEGYWLRDKALDVGHALEELVQTAEDRSLECGATIRVNFRRRPGGGIRRVYDVDKFMPELHSVRYDQSYLDVAAGYYGVSFTSKALIYQFDSLTGTTDGPWHFDTFYPEMKALLFLQDVNERCGPTAYIKGSHRLHGFRLRNEWFGYGCARAAVRLTSKGHVFSMI